ncbi:DapH/DapD/GlmU-related protein [Aneurinibacillus terranovensis]|uniref:DapH/DapD/GlmU-related protein n=1 Tax=Aneurinibacillus terranovensis TaxID=278991 RepID=UPI000400C817|nr:DapH/DapD/GlmU-related protein [Aneurinibacillus terranovensis]
MITGNVLQQPVKASWLANKLNLTLQGPDIEIIRVSSLHRLVDSSLTFCKAPSIEINNAVLVIGFPGVSGGKVSVIISKNPRLDFARALQLLDEAIGFGRPDDPPQIHPSVKVGQYTVIGRNVIIDEGTVIDHYVVIGDGVQIGRNCRIKSGAIIGEDGFGFERDDVGQPMRIKHLGSVKIGNCVEVGSLTTVCKGTIEDTIIEDYAKIDDHNHIGHNVTVKKNAIVTAGCIFSGGTVIGKGAWVGINALTKQNVKIGDHALIGMGSVVLKDVETGAKVVGNPARMLPS